MPERTQIVPTSSRPLEIDTSVTMTGSDTLCEPVRLRNVSSAESLLGRTIGGNRLSRFLGGGSRSLVFAAERMAGKAALALKLLAPEIARGDPQWRECFLREARAAAQLNHALLLNVMATGVDGEFVYCTMPLMAEGSTLEALQTTGPYSAYEATRIAIEAGRALEVLHSHGTTHGNLKPSNVFVTPGGVVKIGDAAFTKQPLGKIGKNLRATAIAADVLKLAITWHWLLTGGPPGRPATPVPDSCAAVIRRAFQLTGGFATAGSFLAALTATADTLCSMSTAALPPGLIPDAPQPYDQVLRAFGPSGRSAPPQPTFVTDTVEFTVEVDPE